MPPHRARAGVLDCHRPGALPVLGFAFAGANAGALKPLAAHLPEGLALHEFVPPGRGRRFREPSEDRLPALCEQAVAALAALPATPILFGYSLGALLAYETARRLQALGRPPRALVVCALDAPHRLPTDGDVHRRPLPGLREHLARLGGTPREVLDDLSVLACFEPAIRNDYRLVEQYRHAAGDPLACPIVAVAGTRDTQTTVQGVTDWGALTAGRFIEMWLDDGHFFITSHAGAWRKCFDLAAALAGETA